jgi:hypothetical protein
MKLNKKHIAALDMGIHSMLCHRDTSNKPEEQLMLSRNVNRLRQLRILMITGFLQPEFKFSAMFHDGLDEKTDFVKGMRLLTGTPEM